MAPPRSQRRHSVIDRDSIVGELSPLLERSNLERCVESLTPETDDLWPNVGVVYRLMQAEEVKWRATTRLREPKRARYWSGGSTFSVIMHCVGTTPPLQVYLYSRWDNDYEHSIDQLQKPDGLEWVEAPDGSVSLFNHPEGMHGLTLPIAKISGVEGKPTDPEYIPKVERTLLGASRLLVAPFVKVYGRKPWEPEINQ